MPSLSRIKVNLTKAAKDFGWVERNEGGEASGGYDQPLTQVVEDVFVIQPQGLVIRWPNQILRNLIGVHENYWLNKPVWAQFAAMVKGGRYTRLPYAGLAMHPYCSVPYNHYHALMTLLPRVFHYLETSEGSLPPVLVGSSLRNSKPFKFWLNRNEQKLDVFPVIKSKIIHVELLHIYHCPGWGLKKIQKIRTEFGSENLQTGEKKIYLERPNDPKRPLLNENELRKEFLHHGFEPVFMGALSMRQQMEVAASADFAVGIHGAAMVNLLFNRNKNLRILDIKPDYLKFAQSYQKMSNALGFEYAELYGESLKNGQEFTVDVNHVRENLQNYEH